MNEAQQWRLIQGRLQRQCQELDRNITRCLVLGYSSIQDSQGSQMTPTKLHEVRHVEKTQTNPWP